MHRFDIRRYFFAKRAQNAALIHFPIALFLVVVAWQWALGGERLKGVLLLHLMPGSLSSLLMWVVWFIHKQIKGKEQEVSRYACPSTLWQW